jgi:hypothetical protein
MSELQLGLLGIGIAVVLAVVGYNKWQEARVKRRVEGSFGVRRADVLLRSSGAAEASPAATAHRAEPVPAPETRVEHTLGDPVAPEPAHQTPETPQTPPAATLDPLIDYIVELACAPPVAGADVAHHARGLVGEGLVKPVHWEGLDEAREAWVAIESTGHFRRVRVGLQLANRAGPVAAEDLLAFRASVQEVALALAAEADFPETDAAVQRAQALDRFGAEVDIQIGLSVIGSESHTFPGGKIRGLAESAGLKIGRDGRFHRPGEDGVELFTLVNLEPMPFHPETMKTLQTRGITALFDVPRVPPSSAAFRRFVDFAHQLEQTLGGVLVDDNRKPIGQAALEAITQQLAHIHRTMEAARIPAGSPAALRLFS